MTRNFRYPSIILILVMTLMACRLFTQPSDRPEEAESVVATSTGVVEPPPGAGMPEDELEPVVRDKPPQSQVAEIRPPEMREELTYLSNLIGYQVLDENGNLLGVAADYIVNTCETYIIYILMEPVESLGVPQGNYIIIPFEAVTINSGVLDAQNSAIHLRLIPGQFVGAPTLAVGQDLTPTVWESEVQTFWSNHIRIGVLDTSCNVPGGPIYKVAYATELLGVELYDGLQNPLGKVQEAILEPESGKLSFYIVNPNDGSNLVMLHLRATNIPEEALQSGAELSLVLLTEPQVFWDAPRINSPEEAASFELQSKMRDYWNR